MLKLASAFILILTSSVALAKPKYAYTLSESLRFSEHIVGDASPSSEKVEGEFIQKAKYNSRFSGVFGGRIWYEGVYSQYPEQYSKELMKEDALDLRLMDFYVQYSANKFLLRVGNQTVVWSETFALPNSDLVNPKDFRDGGLGSMRSLRLPTPMINGQLTLGAFTWQALYLPQPKFNLLPLPGSDFAQPLENVAPGLTLNVERETSKEWSPENAEFGTRASWLINGFDFSAFYLNAFDKSPYYSATLGLNRTLNLKEQHSRVSTAGITGTVEKWDSVFRFELFNSSGRKRPVLLGTSLGSAQTDELVSVFGFDLPTWKNINFGAQWSESVFQTDANYIDRPRHQRIFSAHLHRQFFLDHDFQFLYAFGVSDGGQRFGVEYILPISNAVELGMGADQLTGPSTSEFGRAERGSRAYVFIKGSTSK